MFCFENDIRTVVNFNLSSEKSKNLHFDEHYVVFELKKYRGVVS